MKNSAAFFDLQSRWLITPVALQEYEKNIRNQPATLPAKPDVNALLKVFDKATGNIAPSSNNKSEEKRIGYMQMIGPVVTYGNWFAYGADEYLYGLRAMNNDPRISAIVLDVDGPGGAVPAINAFKEFESEKSKPIIVLCNQLCSLHYWMSALLADHIMAKGSVSPEIGSIGATCIITDVREAMAKEGVKVLMVNAPGSELKGKAYKDFYEGKDEEFIERLKAELKPIRDAFVADIKEARPNISSDERIFAADTFNATQALKLGLIDSIGNEKKAFEMAQVLAELNQ